MNRRTIFVGIAAVLIALLLAIWLLRTPKPTAVLVPTEDVTKKSEVTTSEMVPPPQTLPPPTSAQRVVQPPSRGASEAEKWAWWREMSEKDRFFEYKMPISFFGRVVDDVGVPIPEAKIQFTWTDLSSEGTSKREMQSDTAGFFSLDGAVGKGLSVRVSKEGYKHYFAKNRFSFEYAMFADPKYHVPNRASPVVFVLRKNHEAESLIVRENQETELAPGQSKSFAIGPNGAAVSVERLPNTVEGPRGWAARLSVPNGGLLLTTDEFPFEAPDNGYAPSLEITVQTPKPPAWPGDNGAALFVKTATGYGRITVRNTPGMAWVYVSSYFNPKPGSRNLEYDPLGAAK